MYLLLHSRRISDHRNPPDSSVEILKELGPGLIISATIVGSGELIVTTKLGTDVGFALLWYIILGCMIKVLLEAELGRHMILNSRTTLDTPNGVPGPRFKVSWLVWCWIVMFVATLVLTSGMVGGIAGVFVMVGSELSDSALAFLITGSCAILLFIGRYTLIERFSTAMVAGFALFTIFAVFSLYWTDFGITSEQLAEGFRFTLPKNFIVAFAAFGVIGVGASELIFYPCWCLEKGYAKHIGPREDTVEWTARARGWYRVMRWDAWASLVIYTGATVAFYLLGAAVLNAQNLTVDNTDLIFYVAIGSPVSLMLFGAIAQALMLPLLCFGALYHLHRDTRPNLHPSPVRVFLLWLSAALMAATGLYQFLSVIGVVAS